MWGEAALKLGREWLGSPERDLRCVAARVMRTGAAMAHVPWLRCAVRREIDTCDQDILCTLLNAFERLPDLGRVPELEHVYAETADPEVRRCALCALVVTAPKYVSEELAPEALWDASLTIREIAAGAVSLEGVTAVERVREICEDPRLDEWSRDRIVLRLAQAQATGKEANDGSGTLAG